MDATAGAGRKIGDRTPGGQRRTLASAVPERPVLILIFLISLVIPLNFFLGTLRLSPYRVLLLVMFIPLFVQWISGKMGRVILPDVLILIYSFWIPLALMVNHGSERVAFGGVTALESFGAYLLGRVMIQGRDAFAYFVRCLLIVLLALLPWIAIEALTGNRLIATIVRGAGMHFGIAHQEMRWGMNRAQGPFEHPILWGVFASSGFALAYYSLGLQKKAVGLLWTAIAGLATFFSLSMGAFLSGMIQMGLILYDKISGNLKNRWRIFLSMTIATYIFFYMFSHRGLVGIFIANFAFNHFAASVRLQTWDFGTDVVLANPLFGIGFHDWPRPFWLTGSVDNFWLLNAMRYGLPAALALVAAVILIAVRIGRSRIDDPMVAAQRLGFLFSLAGICFALTSVHAWNALYSYFFFLVGAGVWMIDAPSKTQHTTHRDRASSAIGGDSHRERHDGTPRRPGEPRSDGLTTSGRAQRTYGTPARGSRLRKRRLSSWPPRVQPHPRPPAGCDPVP